MIKFHPIETKLNDGQILLVREATPRDAEPLVDYVETISAQSDYLTFGPGEFGITVPQEEQFLAGLQLQENSIYLVALIDEKIVGSMSFMGGRRPRTAHAGEFGLSVLKEYWGQGIGTVLVQSLIQWCRETGNIRKINLRVRPDNAAAIHLYREVGFKDEGRITREFQINGEFYDSLAMGYEID